jgi:hypothetical protein
LQHVCKCIRKQPCKRLNVCLFSVFLVLTRSRSFSLVYDLNKNITNYISMRGGFIPLLFVTRYSIFPILNGCVVYFLCHIMYTPYVRKPFVREEERINSRERENMADLVIVFNHFNF